MYGVALKPQLLRSLLREYIPDEKHSFRNSLDVSHAVSAVKTHHLLWEWAPSSTDQKLSDGWKSAVDAWVNRVSALASSSMPDKSWAGICLLGLTSQECSSERFLASYSEWFNKILSHMQPPSDSHFVRVASCASMSDLFTRLGGFPNAKKDGNSQASKLIQPVLKLLNEDSSDAFWEEAISLLCTLTNVFPASVSRHYDGVESSIFSKFMSENCPVSIFKKLAHGLALLPKSRGDEDSWSLMMQKVLIFINNQLNVMFQGLEEEARSSEVVRLLLPPGKDPPPPLGGLTASAKNSDQAMKRPEQVLVSRVSTLMTCCCTMLTDAYPVQVSVPVRSLVALVKRVLMVDGSFSQSSPFMTAMRQDLICLELPELHRCSLELLSSNVKGLRSQLLPHVADITRLLTEYFRTCVLPELRIKVYSIMKVLLMSMGIVATNACKVGWADNNSTVVYGEATPIWADFQLAALRALLASLLSPGRVRPPHLAQGLELFHRGSRESGTKISEYCCHALLTLEVLIHPRALPFIDLQSAVDHYGSASLNLPDVHFADHRKNTSFHFSTLGKEPSLPESGDDDLYERWLANGDETDVNDLGKYTSSDKKPSGTSTDPALEKLPHGGSPSERNKREGGEFGESMAVAADKVPVDGDEIMVDLPTPESYKQTEERDHIEGRILVATAGGHTAIESDGLVSGSATSADGHTDFVVAAGKDVSSSASKRNTMVTEQSVTPTSAKDVVTSQDHEYTRIVEKISATISNTGRGAGLVLEINDDTSMDSLPDIVDGDPDSD
ncbi:uncharacterized protein LOC113760878 isoform X2 [Coffea eugenioides]|uniref:uncharacterized protein LOC113760878 isoform X2 n=1 Tax=Coffea eugenioides TaxID=49369 RepID=UPI000F6113F5|nr:uncharacterized protein LOC113760878 isoform X2 [Coffea eugenioides]